MRTKNRVRNRILRFYEREKKAIVEKATMNSTNETMELIMKSMVDKCPNWMRNLKYETGRVIGDFEANVFTIKLTYTYPKYAKG